jgi:DNA invertase Pin-like site-specific DNA recombinase
LKYFARIKLPESPHPPFVPRSVRYKDSDKRQLAAISAYAKANGFDVVGTYYDAAVSGADPVTDRAGFAEMLERLLSNGARTIIVESPDRFARDLMVQFAGHDMLKAKGIALIAASAPTFFLEDTPTAVLVRQVPGGHRAIPEGWARRQACSRSEAQAHRERQM